MRFFSKVDERLEDDGTESLRISEVAEVLHLRSAVGDVPVFMSQFAEGRHHASARILIVVKPAFPKRFPCLADEVLLRARTIGGMKSVVSVPAVVIDEDAVTELV